MGKNKKRKRTAAPPTSGTHITTSPRAVPALSATTAHCAVSDEAFDGEEPSVCARCELHTKQNAPNPALGGLSGADLRATISAVRLLTARPDLFAAPSFKELRTALHPLVQLQLKRYDPVDYVARVTAALTAGKWSDALAGLAGAAAHAQLPKQGTKQRWVRFCDAIEDTGLRLRLLDAVLRSGEPIPVSASAAGAPLSADKDATAAAHPLPQIHALGEGLVDGAAEIAPPEALPTADGLIRQQPVWFPETAPSPLRSEQDPDLEPDPLSEAGGGAGGIRTVQFTAGGDRQPPNRVDKRIFACAADWNPLGSEGRRVVRQEVPFVPGAFVLAGALSVGECARIMRTAETMGYTEDHPVAKPEPTGIDTCEWLAAPGLAGTLFARVREHLPQRIRGGELAGINAHWRLFRYNQRGVYRPHIDGSWPGSGLDPRTGEYVQDAFRDRRSRLTFLVYLNDGFEGGSTTFYIPAPGRPGELDARGVQPQAGAVLCFPQGNTASLVHEGSAVQQGV
eukprot:gene19447-23253_t